MNRPDLPQHPLTADKAVVQQERQAERHRQPRPLPPPMQTVAKGWWVLRGGQATAEDLARTRRDRQ